ncbi:MAG: preprotein translocase subunit SecA, partial [Eubacteriaceae bacterium]|nr:preprotein translocase subunit SecA [Eubacteriaceae bacterium]
PLIISGSGKKSTNLYKTADAFIKTLKKDTDYTLEENEDAVSITEAGTAKAERYFKIDNLSDVENMEILHHINQALKAHVLKHRDKDYIVKDGEVIIVDEFTGRLMYGRRFSEGLHQAIEAKENVTVARESVTMATITFQNFFRLYNKLSGMTGTAKTEEEEFLSIYNMNVISVPTNKPMIREDLNDVIYKTEKSKFNAVVEEIKERHKDGQPVLVGTISIEKSEILSRQLARNGIKHNVLNAKYHEKEAEIISNAGQKDAVTISTNMAGRGTDIVLGEGVKELGGLHIIGTERHESRRIDNQLRGRAGRQGDVGSSQFFISLEDDLMRIFAGDRIEGIADKLPEDMPIEHGFITRAIESAQKRVETRNFGIRKNVLQFDNVLNKQREVIYAQRRSIFEKEDISQEIKDMLCDVVKKECNAYTSVSEFYEEWDLDGLIGQFEKLFLQKSSVKPDMIPQIKEDVEEFFLQKAFDAYDAQEKTVGREIMRKLERDILLRVVDVKWMEHLDSMDQLRQGVGLQAYGNINPIHAYTQEGFDMFEDMSDAIKEDTVRYILNARIEKVENQKKSAPEPAVKSRDEIKTGGEGKTQAVNKNKV